MRVAALPLVLALTGCAGSNNALSVAACGVADERLGTIVRDPAAVVEYFRGVIAEGRRLADAAKAGQPIGPEAAAWIEDILDLMDRMQNCVPRETALEAEQVIIMLAKA